MPTSLHFQSLTIAAIVMAACLCLPRAAVAQSFRHTITPSHSFNNQSYTVQNRQPRIVQSNGRFVVQDSHQRVAQHHQRVAQHHQRVAQHHQHFTPQPHQHHAPAIHQPYVSPEHQGQDFQLQSYQTYDQPTHHYQTQPQHTVYQSPQPASIVYGSSDGRYSNAVERLYEENARLPLGGFFAKGFTRTFTLLGGWNEIVDGGDDGVSIPALGGSGDFLQSAGNETGFVISGAMGRRHSQRLRSEIEIAIRQNEADGLTTGGVTPLDLDATASVYSVMKNVFFEYANASRITPYAGVGIGISYVEAEAETSFDNSVFDDSDSVFSWQVIGGFATRVNRATDFVIEYRYFEASDVELDQLGTSDSYRANNLFLGFKFEY